MQSQCAPARQVFVQQEILTEFLITQKKSAPELGTDHIRPQPPCFPFETSTKRQRTDIRDSGNGEQPGKSTCHSNVRFLFSGMIFKTDLTLLSTKCSSL